MHWFLRGSHTSNRICVLILFILLQDGTIWLIYNKHLFQIMHWKMWHNTAWYGIIGHSYLWWPHSLNHGHVWLSTSWNNVMKCSAQLFTPHYGELVPWTIICTILIMNQYLPHAMSVALLVILLNIMVMTAGICFDLAWYVTHVLSWHSCHHEYFLKAPSLKFTTRYFSQYLADRSRLAGR